MGTMFLGLSKVVIVSVVLLQAIQATTDVEGDFRGSLEFLVESQGTFYYANHKLQVDFETAKQYCKSYNMELGSIETKRQYYDLMHQLRPANNYGYWTSATLSGLPTMFRWATTGRLLDESEIPAWENRWFSFDYCIIIYNSMTPQYPAGLYTVKCTNSQPVICQTTSSVSMQRAPLTCTSQPESPVPNNA